VSFACDFLISANADEHHGQPDGRNLFRKTRTEINASNVAAAASVNQCVRAIKMANAVARVVLRCEEAQGNENLGKLRNSVKANGRTCVCDFLCLKSGNAIINRRQDRRIVRSFCFYAFVIRLALVRDRAAGITKIRRAIFASRNVIVHNRTLLCIGHMSRLFLVNA